MSDAQPTALAAASAPLPRALTALLLAWYFVPAYIFSLLIPIEGGVAGAVGTVVGVLASAVILRWVVRRPLVNDGVWTYRGVFFTYAAPADRVELVPLDDRNYDV